MSLRTKLLVGYLVFLGALAGLGGWSVWQLRQMGTVSRRILADNYVSVIAAQDMKESLERQDSAALFALLDRSERAVQQLREHRQKFDAAFETAAHNITEPGEADVIARIKSLRDQYYGVFDEFLKELPTAPHTRLADFYFARLEPLFNTVRAECDRLLTLNQEAMLHKSEAAEATAGHALTIAVSLVMALLVIGLGLAYFLAGAIVEPVRQLTSATTRIAAGDLESSVRVGSTDEIGALANSFNVMARKLRELRRSDMGKLVIAQQMTEAAIDSLYDPVVVTDSLGHVTKLNHAAERLFGSESVRVGKPIAQVVEDSRISAAVSEVLESQKTVAGQELAAALSIATDGRERSYHLRSTPMRDQDGRMVGAVTLLEDVTHLREVDRLKTEFIATASHELRTPLSTIRMGVELLLENSPGALTPSQTDILTTCRDEAVRLDRLVSDLLDLSKIESGQTSPRPIPIPARQLIRDALEPLQMQIDAKGLALEVDVDVTLPSVMADRPQIERVIANLVTNAVAATSRGGRITVNARQLNDYVAVAVRDTGRGIPREYLPRIFGRFVQVPGSATGSAGIGLAISQRIVQAHSGEITVQSEAGRGATFTFTLPVAGQAIDGTDREAHHSDARAHHRG